MSLCIAASARYRGSGSIEPKGVVRQPQKLNKETQSPSACNNKHIPYPRYRAAEEDIATQHQPQQ